MGTRSLICIIQGGDFVVAQYSEFDGYPEGQGLKILSFLQDESNIVQLKDAIDRIYCPTEVELERMYQSIQELDQIVLEESLEPDNFKDISSFGKSPLTRNWPSLSPEAGARILTIIAQPTLEYNDKWGVPVVKQLEFANNTLFCEWAYVVDLDEEVFEVYGGSQKKSEWSCNRFDNVGDENDTVPKLIKSFHFDHLPQTERQFYEAIEPDN